MPFVTHKNSSVHYSDQGKGRTVVFIHGFLENLSMWDDFVAALSKNYRVVCVDLLGHGLTPSIGYVHTMDEMAEAVKSVLNHLKLRKYTLVGHSMGGYVALAFAEYYPDHVASLCLFYSSAKEDTPDKKALRLRAIEAVKLNHKSFVRLTIPSLFRPKNRKIYRNKINTLIEQAQKMSVQGIVAALDGMRERPDREALLHFGPYPVLIICGKRDERLPMEYMKSQLAAPNVVDRLITENGHMGHIEDTQVCIETIDQFLHDTL